MPVRELSVYSGSAYESVEDLWVWNGSSYLPVQQLWVSVEGPGIGEYSYELVWEPFLPAPNPEATEVVSNFSIDDFLIPTIQFEVINFDTTNNNAFDRDWQVEVNSVTEHTFSTTSPTTSITGYGANVGRGDYVIGFGDDIRVRTRYTSPGGDGAWSAWSSIYTV